MARVVFIFRPVDTKTCSAIMSGYHRVVSFSCWFNVAGLVGCSRVLVGLGIVFGKCFWSKARPVLRPLIPKP